MTCQTHCKTCHGFWVNRRRIYSQWRSSPSADRELTPVREIHLMKTDKPDFVMDPLFCCSFSRGFVFCTIFPQTSCDIVVDTITAILSVPLLLKLVRPTSNVLLAKFSQPNFGSTPGFTEPQTCVKYQGFIFFQSQGSFACVRSCRLFHWEFQNLQY